MRKIQILSSVTTSRLESPLDEVGPYIEIILKTGKNLVKRDLKGYSDPYIIFKAGLSVKKSKVIKKTLNPEWNQHFRLNLSPEYLKREGYLYIECWSYHLLSNHSYMGGIEISLRNLTNDFNYQFSEKFQKVESGTLNFEIKPKNFQVSSYGSLKIDPKFIVDKLKNSKRYKDVDDESVKFLAKILSNSEMLKEKYLSMKWADSLSVYRSLSKVFNIDDDFELVQNGDHIYDKILEKEVKIKIIVADQAYDSNFQTGLRKLISPIIDDFHLSSMGLFHTALLIGPWFIEWNDSAICIPRKCLSRSAFLTIDVGEIKTIETLESIRDKIADVIVYWNANVEYDSYGKSKKGYGNCQEFIESILHALNMNIEYTGVIGDFLQNMKRHGSSKLIFPINQQMKFDFCLREDEIEFTSHSQLDKFVHSIEEKSTVLFEETYPNEYLLLKSFDRAFWLKHQKSVEDYRKNQKTKILLTAKQTTFSKKYTEKEYAEKIQKIDEKLLLLEKHAKVTKCLVHEKEENSVDVKRHNCAFGNPFETKSFIQ
eukprot:gene10213-2633_t